MQTPTPHTPSPQPHPSRTAPKCVDCRHLVFRCDGPSITQRPADLCGHPCAPVDPVTGRETLMAAEMRQDFIGEEQATLHPYDWCGAAGRLFEPLGLPLLHRLAVCDQPGATQ